MYNQKEDIKYHYLIFLFSPVLGLIYSFKTKSRTIIRWSLFAFTTIYGSLFNKEFLGDGAHHWERVYEHYQYLDFKTWWTELVAIISLNPLPATNDDIYIHVLSYLVGGLLNAPGLFFVPVAMVYAYFYSGTMVKVLSYVNWTSPYNKFFFGFFLTMLLLWLQPLDMQTVRSWTAAWVLFYAAISYYETKKLKYLVLALTPPLIHIGWIALSIPIWVVLFSGFRNPKVYFIVFVVSILASNILEQYDIAGVISEQSELGKDKTDAYYYDEEERSERIGEYQEQFENKNFYHRFARLGGHRIALQGVIIFIFLYLRKRGFGALENALFSYALAMASFSNFFIAFFAIYNRGWQMAGFLILSSMVIFLSKQNFKKVSVSFFKVKLPLFLFVLAILPYLFFCFSNFLRFTSPYMILMPVVSWIDSDAAIGIRDVIGYFL